ncbi:hypothetical protein GGR57DRAFT_257810 [Xylariaceae sp. FL1272]|nr:hypothetical protein GGR57DRAFT_257810 [Xylariaceae sp. FL1272]
MWDISPSPLLCPRDSQNRHSCRKRQPYFRFCVGNVGFGVSARYEVVVVSLVKQRKIEAYIQIYRILVSSESLIRETICFGHKLLAGVSIGICPALLHTVLSTVVLCLRAIVYLASAMSTEFTEFQQCTCNAFFRTDIELESHIHAEYIISLEDARRVEQGRSHSKATATPDDASNLQDDATIQRHRGPDGLFYCPEKGCDQKTEKAYTLRRHFGSHIRLYYEPCVCCRFLADAVSDYIGHVSQHKNFYSEAKMAYSNRRANTCQLRQEE